MKTHVAHQNPIARLQGRVGSGSNPPITRSGSPAQRASRRPRRKELKHDVQSRRIRSLMTTLSDTQKDAVRSWLQAGLQLPEIQKRLAAEFDLRLTYMEVKVLVSELAVLPKDLEQPKPVEIPPAPAGTRPLLRVPGGPLPCPPAFATHPWTPGARAGGCRRVRHGGPNRAPGALASGKARFSDGKQAGWYLDESGRLGLVAPEPGYRPPAADVPEFQAALERLTREDRLLTPVPGPESAVCRPGFSVRRSADFTKGVLRITRGV